MPMTTYIENAELLKISHPQIIELLVELNDKTADGWIVRETIEGGFFSRRSVFSLCKKLWGIEYQVINLYREESASSLNPYYPADLIIAYMTGFLAGLEKNV